MKGWLELDQVVQPTDESLYGTVDNPVGHRFGKLTSAAVCIEPKSRNCLSVLFRCDCGRFRRVAVSAIHQKNVPEMCHKCEKNSEPPEDDISELIEEYREEYRQWRVIRDRGILCKRWRSFRQFMIDCGRCPKNQTLQRKNQNKHHAPENSFWCDHVPQPSAKTECVDGMPMTANKLSEKWGIFPSWLIRRRKKGLTLQQIVDEWVMTHPMNPTLWFDIPNTDKRYQVNPALELVKDGNKVISPFPDGNGLWVYRINFRVSGQVLMTYQQLKEMSVSLSLLKAPLPNVPSAAKETKAVEPTPATDATVEEDSRRLSSKPSRSVTESATEGSDCVVRPSTGVDADPSHVSSVFVIQPFNVPPSEVPDSIRDPENGELRVDPEPIQPDTAAASPDTPADALEALDDQTIVQPVEAPQNATESVTEVAVEPPIEPLEGLETEIPQPPPGKRKLSAEESTAMVKKMIADGKTLEQIAERFGVSVDKIERLASA